MSFHRVELKDFEKEGKDPWQYVKAILESKQSPPMKYLHLFDNAQQKWRALARKPIRLNLIDVLVKFELTSEQIWRIIDPDERKKSGINATEEELINNPYIICESDLGTATSDPISLDVI